MLGGIADSLNAPAPFLRFVFLILATWTPWLWWTYAFAALVVPRRGSRRPDWDNVIGLSRLAVVMGCGWLINPLSSSAVGNEWGPPSTWIPYAGLLIAGATLLLTADYCRKEPRSRAETRATVLGALPVVALAVGLGVGIVLAPDIRWDRFLPLAVICMGAALILSTRRPGWRALLAPTIVGAAVAAALVASDARLEGGVGDVRVASNRGGELPVLRRAVGDIEVDLSRLERDGDAVTIRASAGVGDIKVIVRNSARVTLEAKVGRGTIDSFPYNGSERGAAGYGLVLTHEWKRPLNRGGPMSGPPIRIVAEAGLGDVNIEAAGVRS